MNILFTRFPLESANGGAENQTMWLASGLAKRGHSVSFLGSCPVLLSRFSAQNLSTHSLQIGSPPVTKTGALSFFWRRFSMQKSLVHSIDALPQKPDVVCMLSLSEKLLLTPLLANRGIKVVWIEHDRIGRWLTRNPWLPTLKACSTRALIVTVSKLSEEKYRALGFDAAKIAVIPNGIPAPQQPASSSATKSGFHIGCVSRLSPEKGIDVLLSAVRHIPEATVHVVGEGSEEGYLRSLIAEDEASIGLRRITLRHRVDNLDTFYASLNALVLPSTDHDPFGLVAAEAMARGIPVIVTDACGIASSLTHGRDALIVRAGSIALLADAIRRLLDPSEAARIAGAGKDTASTIFALDRMVEAYERVLAQNEEEISR